jgi:hypothetical protein
MYTTLAGWIKPISLRSLVSCAGPFLILLALCSSASAQQADTNSLLGTWRGSLTTTFQGKSISGEISLTFLQDGKVILQMPETERGTYRMDGDTLQILIGDKKTPDIVFKAIRFSPNSLLANLTFSSDLQGMTNKVRLLRQAPTPNIDGESTGISHPCKELDLPLKLEQLFAKYDLTCPIAIPKNASYYEKTLLTLFVEDVVRTLTTVKDVHAKYIEIAKIEVDVETNADDAQIEAKVENILKPLFQDPDSIGLAGPPCPFPPCALSLEDWTGLKNQYVKNSRIDFDRVWSTIIEITDSKDGVKLDRRSLIGNETDRRIEGQRDVYVPQDSGYMVVEKLVIEMKDAEKKRRPGEILEINIESHLWKRKARSYRADEIKDGTSISAGSATVVVSARDSQIMQRIKSAIFRFESIL